VAIDFKQQLEIKRRAARALERARVEVRPSEPKAKAKLPTMTSEEIAAEIERLDAEERWEAERPAREAAARKAKQEAKQERIAKARRDISQRWINDPKTKAYELRKFDRRLRKKGR
jgi:hypothetical protein